MSDLARSRCWEVMGHMEVSALKPGPSLLPLSLDDVPMSCQWLLLVGLACKGGNGHLFSLHRPEGAGMVFHAGPQGSIAKPEGSITKPEGFIEGPEDAARGLHLGAQGSITGPESFIAGPKGSITGPEGSITGPECSTTGPEGSIAGPKGSSDMQFPSGSGNHLKAWRFLQLFLVIASIK